MSVLVCVCVCVRARASVRACWRAGALENIKLHNYRICKWLGPVIVEVAVLDSQSLIITMVSVDVE